MAPTGCSAGWFNAHAQVCHTARTACPEMTLSYVLRTSLPNSTSMLLVEQYGGLCGVVRWPSSGGGARWRLKLGGARWLPMSRCPGLCYGERWERSVRMEPAGASKGPWVRNRSPGPQAQDLCPGINNRPYLCESGHCCGETGCCTYYYELWWFWLLWSILILLSCCCAYRHRRAKLRLQQQQRQREINLIAYQRAYPYPPSMLDLRVLASCKLPAYEEVACRPTTPPPPYSSVPNQLGLPSSSPPPPPSEGVTPSPSTDLSSSCSCDSDCLTSASSSSFSVQVTDETCTSPASTPSDRDGWPQCSEEDMGEAGAPSMHKQAAFSSYVDFFEGSGYHCWDIEEEEEEDEEQEEEHYRHRRLTGDSGIEVCRCQIQGEEESEGLHDNPGCPGRNKAPDSQCNQEVTEPNSPIQSV